MTSLRVNIISTLIASLGLIGCAQSPTKNIITTDFILGKDSRQLTFLGDNERPRFSEDGKHLLYASRKRTHHQQSQIYELNLLSNRERRVTFSDGDAFDPVYISDHEILYASTTDEIKERPLKNKSFEATTPPSDLYMSDTYGSEIVRLSFQPGYDGEPAFAAHPTKPFILFSSQRGNQSGLYRMDLKNIPVSFLSVEKGTEKRSPTISPDMNQVAWIEKDLESKKEKLVLYSFKTRKKEILQEGEDSYHDVFWAPQPPHRLFYSIRRKGDRVYQIESLQLDKRCTQVVFKGRDSLMFPTVSNEKTERLAFVRLFKDKRQIYLAPVPQDLGPCIDGANQANLKE